MIMRWRCRIPTPPARSRLKAGVLALILASSSPATCKKTGQGCISDSRYDRWVTTYEAATLSVSVLAFIVSTVVLLLLVKQIKLLSQQVNDAAKQAQSENERQRKQATMDFVSATLSKLQELFNSLPASGSPQEPVFLRKAMVRDSLEFLALRNYLNYLEDLCIGVNMEIIDQEVIRRSMGARIRNAWRLYESWIVQEREILQRPVFDELEACARVFTALIEAKKSSSHVARGHARIPSIE